MTGVSRRSLLSTATALAFAIGFGAGVSGAWLLDHPTGAGPRAALAAVDRPAIDRTGGGIVEPARERLADTALAAAAGDRLAARPAVIEALQAEASRVKT